MESAPRLLKMPPSNDPKWRNEQISGVNVRTFEEFDLSSPVLTDWTIGPGYRKCIDQLGVLRRITTQYGGRTPILVESIEQDIDDPDFEGPPSILKIGSRTTNENGRTIGFSGLDRLASAAFDADYRAGKLVTIRWAREGSDTLTKPGSPWAATFRVDRLGARVYFVNSNGQKDNRDLNPNEPLEFEGYKYQVNKLKDKVIIRAEPLSSEPVIFQYETPLVISPRLLAQFNLALGVETKEGWEKAIEAVTSEYARIPIERRRLSRRTRAN